MAQDFIASLKKIARWSLWSAAGGMLLVVTLHFLLPSIVDGEALKRQIRTHLDPETYGDIDFDQLRIALLPLPAVVATRASYALAGRVTLQAEQVAFHPHLGALLRGRVRLATLLVHAPTAVLDLPDAAPPTEPRPDIDRAPLTGRLSAVLARLPRDARVTLDQGRLALRRSATPLIQFDDLTLSLVNQGDRLHLDLSGGSDRIERFQLEARLDNRTLDSQGDIELNGIRIAALSDETLPLPIRHGRVQVEGNLRLRFETKGLESLQVNVHSDLPAITLARGSHWVRAQQISLEAGAELSGQGLRATLGRLKIEQPRLDMDGTLAWDAARADQAPAVQLDLNLRETDVTALRAFMVNISGKGRSWALWETIRGGMLESMALHAEGRGWQELGRLGNLQISGKASQAQITVPGVNLDLSEVNGDWQLEKGTLTVAPGATARSGGILASRAALSLDLAGDTNPIDLSLNYTADLADLPTLLKKLIPDESTRAELARVGRTHGQGAGQLRLTGTLQDLHVRVEARDVFLSAEYDRLPFPVQIKAPQLVYTDGQIRFSGVYADMGASALSAVTGRVAWQPSAELSLEGRTARLSAGEIFTWLKGMPDLGPRMTELQSLTGTLLLHDFAFSGPPGQAGQWRYRCAGTFDTLSLEPANLTEPINLVDGRFDLETPQKEEQETGTKTVRLDIQKLNMACADQRAALNGTISYRQAQWQPALVVSSGRLDLARLVSVFKSAPAADAAGAPPVKGGMDLDGRIAIAVEQLVYGSYLWEPVRAEAVLAKGQTTLDVTKANLCGISTVGRLIWDDKGLSLEVQPSTRGQNIQYTSGCLIGTATTERIEGTLEIQGKISATGPAPNTLLANAQGELRLGISKGRITNLGRVGFFTNLLSFLSVNNIVRPEGLNLAENDLPFKRIDIEVLIHNGVAHLQEARFTSRPLNIVGEGKVHLTTRETAIVLLVSPLTAADAVIQRIPVVGRILKGTLVAVPVEVKGPISDPSIRPMSVKAVGSRLLGIMERTVTAPLQLVDPFLKTPEPTPEAAE